MKASTTGNIQFWQRASLVCVAFICFLSTVSQAQQVCNNPTYKTSIGNGAFIVQNNEWGSPGSPECINITDTGFFITGSELNNSPDNPDPTKRMPGGYPSIYAGCHYQTDATDCSSTATSNLPQVVSDIASATSSWDTAPVSSSPASDIFDVAYDIWFNSTPNVTTDTPDRTELMIWLNFRGDIHPAGNLDSSVSQFSNAGATYDVWIAPPDPASNRPWSIISYVLHTPNGSSVTTSSVTNLDLLAFINDAATAHHYVDPSSYLVSVEAGFEIWSGGNNLASNSFSFSLTPGPNPGLGTANGGCAGMSAAPLNIWWPTDGSTQSGIQPFKARLENLSLGCYQMHWAVDAGQANLMSDNTDHKEASADLSGWNWRDAGDRFGPFAVNFTAQDTAGNLLQQKAITMYVAKPALSIWWPSDGSVLSGTQPFKARLENLSLSSYQMYWSVDGGQLNLMDDNVDHKEASVDLSGWTWRDAGSNYGPFAVMFIAKTASGTVLQQKSVTIYRAK
jgi:hypothetical protein